MRQLSKFDNQLLLNHDDFTKYVVPAFDQTFQKQSADENTNNQLIYHGSDAMDQIDQVHSQIIQDFPKELRQTFQLNGQEDAYLGQPTAIGHQISQSIFINTPHYSEPIEAGVFKMITDIDQKANLNLVFKLLDSRWKTTRTYYLKQTR